MRRKTNARSSENSESDIYHGKEKLVVADPNIPNQYIASHWCRKPHITASINRRSLYLEASSLILCPGSKRVGDVRGTLTSPACDYKTGRYNGEDHRTCAWVSRSSLNPPPLYSTASNAGTSCSAVPLLHSIPGDPYTREFTKEWSTAKVISDEPNFELPIINLTIPVGREAVLSCTVNNLGKYKVAWVRAEDQTILTLHTKVVTHNSRVSVAHDNLRTWQLRIRQLKETDRGCYMCQINTAVMKIQQGCLDVYVPPDIVYDDTSGDLAVAEGDNATLWCRATGHPTPRITWRREDGGPIILRKGTREAIRVDTYNGSQLHFWRLDRRQMGAYLCIASNDVPPAVSKRIALNVNFAPVIKVPNQLLGAPLGTDVQLECYVEAFPNTINYWVKNRGEMLLNGSKYSIREERSGYKVFMWLVIRSFSRLDIGTYNCVSTNSLGRAEGTLRLYEIKMYAGAAHGDNDNHVSIIGGLAEAARGQTSRKDGHNQANKPAHPLNWMHTLTALTILQYCTR
ncbi:Dpr-interacting protein gamma [Carabus blaptoides fortunei]